MHTHTYTRTRTDRSLVKQAAIGKDLNHHGIASGMLR